MSIAGSRSIVCVVVSSLGIFAQTASAPAFDVASVKRSTAENGSFIRYLPGGRFSAMSWVKQLIEASYDFQSYQVAGGPAWLVTDRYEIEARTEDQKAGATEMKRMLQALLADRFKLKLHREVKEFSVYALVVDKNGSKLTPLKPGDSSNCRRDNSEICGIRRIAQLANYLQSIIGRPVLDETGTDGEFDVLLQFDVFEARNQTAPPDYNKPTLLTALREQLGLRLDPQKTSFPILVIDGIQRPSEN